MENSENLMNTNNYKILIQLKKDRRKKLKTRFLTPEFIFSENENEALEFSDLQNAETFLQKNKITNLIEQNPRIIIKYIGE